MTTTDGGLSAVNRRSRAHSCPKSASWAALVLALAGCGAERVEDVVLQSPPTLHPSPITSSPTPSTVSVVPRATVSLDPQSGAQIDRFITVAQNLPVWQMLRLPAPGYDAYADRSSGLVVGDVIGPIDEVSRVTFNPEDVGAYPDTPGSVTVVSALMNVAVGVDDVSRPSQVKVPIAFWAAALPPDFDRIQKQTLKELNDSLPVGATVAVLVVDDGQGPVVDVPTNGIVPSLAAMTFVRGDELVNVDPTIGVKGLERFDLDGLREYVADGS